MEMYVEVQDSPYQEGKKRLKLAAQATLDVVLTHPECPVFLQSALRGKLSWQKRNEFTVEKTLLAPGMAPQWVGALLAWGGWVVFADGSEQPLADLLGSARKPNDISALHLPLDVPGREWAEARTGSTPADFPIVWAMAVVDQHGSVIKNARLALTGVWSQSVALAKSAELLAGKPLGEDAIQQIAAAVEAEVSPKGDYRGSAEYRKAMAGVMTRRALQQCQEGEDA
jgi:CO/xanthine dehydrogenase FAD-binding subunit